MEPIGPVTAPSGARETVADVYAERDSLRAALSKAEQQAAAYREMGPYLDRLQAISQILGWPLGGQLLKSAVMQLEADHRILEASHRKAGLN